MVPALPAQVARNAKRTHITPAACFTVHAALDAPLRFKAGELSAVMYELMPAHYHDMRRAFDALRYGEFSPTPLVGVGQLTQHDPSRCPEGKAIFHAWDYVPYDRPDGRSWDEAKREFAGQVIDRMSDFIDNVPDVVLDYHCDSPVDMERTSPSFHRGDLHGIATTTYQSGSHRPTPDPGTVPEGKVIFHAWDYVPDDRPDGRSWDEAKREFAGQVIERMSDFIDNGPDVVLDYHCDSPVDMERTSPSFHRGDLHGIATTTYQSGSHRPTPEL